MVLCDHNTPPHHEYSSSHGVLGDLFEAQESAEVTEFVCVQCFCKNIGNVIMGVNVGEGNFIRLDTLAKEVMFDVDVFDAIV